MSHVPLHGEEETGVRDAERHGECVPGMDEGTQLAPTKAFSAENNTPHLKSVL